MTPQDGNNATLTASCPSCGVVCIWYGVRTEPGNGTRYRIACLNCPIIAEAG